MENILISACLLDINCRYDGKSSYKEDVFKDIERLKKSYNLIPICPEILGGLSTPRDPSERIKDKVISKKGKDVSDEFNRGARESLKLMKFYKTKKAILKEKSPSCGKGIIYDGSFTGNKTQGNGVTVDLFLENGIEVFGESEIKNLI